MRAVNSPSVISRGARSLSSTRVSKKKKDSEEASVLPFKTSDLVELCKRRGFVFQSSEIYSPMSGFFDYGPLGVEMRNNIKKLW